MRLYTVQGTRPATLQGSKAPRLQGSKAPTGRASRQVQGGGSWPQRQVSREGARYLGSRTTSGHLICAYLCKSPSLVESRSLAAIHQLTTTDMYSIPAWPIVHALARWEERRSDAAAVACEDQYFAKGEVCGKGNETTAEDHPLTTRTTVLAFIASIRATHQRLPSSHTLSNPDTPGIPTRQNSCEIREPARP